MSKVKLNTNQVESSWLASPLLVAVVIVAAIIIRFLLLLPGNSFITDEAYYLGAGVEILHSAIDSARHYYQYTTGCVYIFPFMAAIAGAFAERFGIDGIVGVRLLNIALSLLSVIFVYKSAGILAEQWIENNSLRKWMAFFSSLIFALSSCVLYVGTLGTYDCPSLTLFAFGIWMLVRAVFHSNAKFGRFINAALAGIAIALSMITRYFPLVFIPAVALIAAAASFHFIRDRIQRKIFNSTAFLLIIFGISFLVVFGGYVIAFYDIAMKPALGHNQTNIEALGRSPVYQLVLHVFDKYGFEMTLAIIGALWLSLPYFNASAAGKEDGIWSRRIYSMAALMLIPIGGVAFQIVGPHNFFAYTKNLAYPILAAAPLSGFGAAMLMERFSHRRPRLCWFISFCLLVGFAARSLKTAKAHHIFGGLNHTEFTIFIAKQLSDPQFRERYALFQNHVVGKFERAIPYFAAILLISLALWLWRRRKKTVLAR
jgi:hypothetical protein